MRRAIAVSTTAFANFEENSTLGQDAMHSTRPLKKASCQGRGRCGRWDATPRGRVEDEGAAVASAAVDANE